MKKYLFLFIVILFVLPSNVSAQTDEYSWVYFYYTYSWNPRPTFTIAFNDKEVFRLEKSARIKCKVYSTGNIKISCFFISNDKKRGQDFFTINVQHGKTYYVKLDNPYLELKQVDEITGEREFNAPKLAAIQYYNEDSQNPIFKKEYADMKPAKKSKVKSDVDNNIPVNDITKNNTYALIIGNEDYSSFQTDLSSEVNVDFAINDAMIFKEYCIKTLGIPDKQIKFLTNATLGQMNQGIAWLKNLAKIDNGKAELIFYYSGHGLPDEQTKESYLMPVDISGGNISLAIKLSDVYNKLNVYPAKRVVVFLDACFSGGARNQGLIAMKGVKVKPKENQITGNMIVLSSSTGDESSGVYREKQHGYMTYYLLKKLQKTKGDITYKELADFVIESVTKETALKGKTQTPQCSYSLRVKDVWLNWKLK